MPRDLMTIRLDSTTRSRLRSVALRRGISPSAAVRQAIGAWLVAEDTRAQTRPYEELADIIGCVETPRPSATSRAHPRRRAGRRGGAR